MSDEDDKILAAKYDEIYHFDPFNDRVQPIRVEGRPQDRYQALVYLARPGGRLLEIGCGRGEVLLALAPISMRWWAPNCRPYGPNGPARIWPICPTVGLSRPP